ncbi:4830_t:CDS:2 [Acaulospora colombiana]|uniref:4830_t:CDS:1 n=1 Tax=Acaulospora colombiana TaxID=27376 RepID=A0ACA9LAC0_9GLOM|nr:4830_t:CDS:2 [Acaulospora colombiana]
MDSTTATPESQGISYLGSIALLVSSITGPGLVTTSLLLCEASSAIDGNDKFQRKIEFSHLTAILVTNKRTRLIIQLFLFVSLQSVNIASILLSAQSMDTVLISLFGKTCGLGIYPESGFYCVYQQGDFNSPFGTNYMVATLGFLITLVMVMPLSIFSLSDNIKVQIASLFGLVFIFCGWLVTFFKQGLKTSYVPLIGENMSDVIGTVIFNYAFITTVPSWVNDLRPNVSIRKSVWYSNLIATTGYILLGVVGGMAFQINPTSDIIAVMNESNQKNWLTTASTYVFPVAVLITTEVKRQASVRSARSIKDWIGIQTIAKEISRDTTDASLGILNGNNIDDSATNPDLRVLDVDDSGCLIISTLPPPSQGNPERRVVSAPPVPTSRKFESVCEDSNSRYIARSLQSIPILNRITSNRRRVSPPPSTEINSQRTSIPTIVLCEEGGHQDVIVETDRSSSEHSKSEKSDSFVFEIPPERFKAFPVSAKKRLWITYICSAGALLTVISVILYDLIETVLGNDVFD